MMTIKTIIWKTIKFDTSLTPLVGAIRKTHDDPSRNQKLDLMPELTFVSTAKVVFDDE